jgi:hypothetical protein
MRVTNGIPLGISLTYQLTLEIVLQHCRHRRDLLRLKGHGCGRLKIGLIVNGWPDILTICR